jgi:hypothetical protein
MTPTEGASDLVDLVHCERLARHTRALGRSHPSEENGRWILNSLLLEAYEIATVICPHAFGSCFRLVYLAPGGTPSDEDQPAQCPYESISTCYHTLAISSLFINDIEKILKLKWTRKDTELADLRPMGMTPTEGASDLVDLVHCERLARHILRIMFSACLP